MWASNLAQGCLGAWQPLSVHGWVYSISHGLITDLNVTVSGPDDNTV
jgi:carbonic anhydrase